MSEREQHTTDEQQIVAPHGELEAAPQAPGSFALAGGAGSAARPPRLSPGVVLALQRSAGNQMVAAQLAVARAAALAEPAAPAAPAPAGEATDAATPGAAPAEVLGTEVIDRELSEVTSIPGVAATTSESGRNVLVPEEEPAPPPPPPPVAEPAPAAPAPERGELSPGAADGATAGGKAGAEIDQAVTAAGAAGATGTVSAGAGGSAAGGAAGPTSAATTSAGDAAAAGAAGPTGAVTAGAGAAMAAGPGAVGPAPAGGGAAGGGTGGQAAAAGVGATPATSTTGLVGPPAPDELAASLPATPSTEAIEEDLLDERSTDQKRAAADAEISGLQASADEQRSAVAADVTGHRETVAAQGQQRRAQIDARLALALEEVTQRATTSEAALHGRAEARKGEITAQVEADAAMAGDSTTAKIAEARDALSAKRQSLTAAAEAERDQSLAKADAEAARAIGELEAAAVHCEQAGERQAAQYPGDEDPAPDQQEAARKVGRESAADIREKKDSIQPELRAKATEHGQRCIDYVSGVVNQLNDAETALAGELRRSGDSAETAIREGLAGALTAVDQRLAADLAAVAAVADAARQSLMTAAQSASSALDADIATADAELAASGEAIDAEIDNSTTETTTLLSQQEEPFLPGVAEQVTAARDHMTSIADGGRAKLAEATAKADTSFGTTADSFDAAAAQTTAQAGTQLDQIAAGFETATEQAAAARTQDAAAVLAQMRQQQQQVADGVLAEAERACQSARAELDRMAGENASTLTEAADKAVEEGTRPKTDDVDTRAHEAAEQVDDGFWAGLGRAIVKIAVGLVVLVVVALIVAGIAAIFGVLLTAWTAIMIAGALLLAASLVFALINRLGQAELRGRPGTAILVALADTVGITGIYEGIGGHDIVTGHRISIADRTERGVLGAVTLVGLIFGARSAIKGPPGGVYTRPVGGLPGWGELGIFARAAEGIRGVAGEIAGAIAKGARSLREWWAERGSADPDPSTPGGQRPGQRPPPQPGELPPENVDPQVVQLGELRFNDQVGHVPEGVTAPEGSTPATVEVTTPDGRFGWATRAYDPATGDFHALQINLADIPPEMRMVETGPNQRVPLSDYLTIRIMRLLNVVVGRLRSVRISEVENVRSVLEIRRGDAVADTQSVRTNADAVIRAGGRVVKAEVVPGTGETITLARLLEIWEGDTPPPDMVARHNAILAEFGITREQAATIEVLSGFDIVIELLPEAAVPPVDPGALPVPVLPGGGGGHHDDDD